MGTGVTTTGTEDSKTPVSIDALYARTIEIYSDGRSVFIATHASELELLANGLDADRKRTLASTMAGYVADNIRRGQLGNLDGVEHILPFMRAHGVNRISLTPTEEKYIVHYHRLMGSENALSIALRSSPRYPDTRDSHEKRMNEYDRADALTQLQTYDPSATDETLTQLRKVSGALAVMAGQNGLIGSLNAPTQYGIATLLEGMVGEPLPRLRRQLKQAALEALDQKELASGPQLLNP